MMENRSSSIQNYNQKGIYIMIICPLMSIAEDDFISCQTNCAWAVPMDVYDRQEKKHYTTWTCSLYFLGYYAKDEVDNHALQRMREKAREEAAAGSMTDEGKPEEAKE